MKTRTIDPFSSVTEDSRETNIQNSNDSENEDKSVFEEHSFNQIK